MNLEIHNNVTDEQRDLKPGDPVIYLRDDGRETRHAVKYEAPYRIPDGTWVVHLTGIAGYVALCRVTKLVVDAAFLLAGARRIKAEAEQYLVDVASWNENNPHGDRIDPDPDGTLAASVKYADGLIRQLEVRGG